MTDQRPAWLSRLAPLAGAGLLALAIGLASCRSTPGLVGEAQAEPEVRVRIRAGVERVSVGLAETEAGGGGFIRVTDERNGTDVLNAPLTLEPWPDRTRGLRVTDARGTTWSIPSGVHLSGVDSNGRPVERPLVVEGARYAGSLFVRPSRQDTSKLDAINLTPMEPYLAGVLSKELYSRWPEETFCVQAVCARSYAMHQSKRARGMGRDYDLEATTADQVFPGLTDHPAANHAIRRTRGIVMAYEGSVLRTYYSSTCGGRTGSARDVWGVGDGLWYNSPEPLQAHSRDIACQESPLYRWETRRSIDDLSTRIRAWGDANGMSVRRLARLTSIGVDKANREDRPVRYRLQDDLGRTFKLPAESLRSACNFAAQGLPAIERATRVHSGDLSARLDGSEFVISGRGFGHGVGMCQFCAKGLADQGVDWRTMLKSFYPGASFKRAY